MRVVCVGGGPGGLYSAILLKRAHPGWDVRVHEANRFGETFGFGVVFSAPTLSTLAEADPKLHADLLARSVQWDPIEVRRADGAIRCYGQAFAAIGRHALLRMLTEEAERVGVALRFGERVDADALPEADVIVAADGGRSAIRKRFAEHFEPSVDVGAAKYIWFGTTHRFESLTFLFEEDAAGAFAVHAYPYDEKGSTFLVETDEATWQRAGFERLARGEEEERASLAYLEKLFAAHLGGHRLVANRSFWTNFRTVRTQRWHHANVVLVGDSAHTVHFSLGSGTKLALEDALALSAALSAESNVEAAFARYDAERRPRARKLQLSAGPSMYWWEHFGEAMRQPLEPFAFRFLTRNYKVTRESLNKRDPAFVERVDRWFADSVGAPPSQRASDAPFTVRGVTLPNRAIIDDDGSSSAGAGLVLRRTPPDAPSAGAAKHGLLVSAAEAATAPLPERGVAWIEIEVDLGAPVEPAVAAVRARWSGPLSARITVERQSGDEIVAAGRAAVAAGADAVTLVAAPGRETRALLAAEALRFPRRVPLVLACAPEIADTLVLSQRADLWLCRRAPA